VSGYNHAVLLGRLAKEPQELRTKFGKLFLRAIIRCRGSLYDEEVEYMNHIPVTIFGRNAKNFLNHVAPGDAVHLVGHLQGHEWQNGGMSSEFVVDKLTLFREEEPKTTPPQVPQNEVGTQTQN
jgi:single-stranded DNA-binding protein